MQTNRERAEYDVVIIGAGAAGLSAAIRLKQLGGEDINVCVLEKGSEPGAHILSGAVMDPVGLDLLIPDWKEKGAPVKSKVCKDNYYILGKGGKMRLPNFIMPSFMHNKKSYVISLGNLCRWLASEAENAGVEIFPGMSASEGVYGDKGELIGVVAGVFGLNKDGSIGENTEPGMEIMGKYVIVAEGARGSLAKNLIKSYSLDTKSDAPKFGLGMKELWEISPEKHKEGQVNHYMGWPLGLKTGGGGFLYHMENNQVSVGFVVHLDYKNPYIVPYKEFQRFKHHPIVASVLRGGKRIAYGARAITEGGLQSLPDMGFPGGILVGCSAGLVNVPRIKGSHNAILSGKMGAEVVFNAIKEGRCNDDLNKDYSEEFNQSLIYKDLNRVKNVKPLWSRFSMLGSLILGGIDMWSSYLFKFNLFGTLHHKKNDAQCTEPKDKHVPIDYPPCDNEISFDILTNVAYSFTNHDESQPAHLKLKDPSVPITKNIPLYDEPAQRYCPAGVYEVHENPETKEKNFVINFQNCVHCKTCDIKDPSQNIEWTTPQGGDGPNYPNM